MLKSADILINNIMADKQKDQDLKTAKEEASKTDKKAEKKTAEKQERKCHTDAIWHMTLYLTCLYHKVEILKNPEKVVTIL